MTAFVVTLLAGLSAYVAVTLALARREGRER